MQRKWGEDVRVLFVNHNSYPEEVTGAEKSLFYDVRALVERGVEAAVLSRKEGLSTEYFRSLGVPVFVTPYDSPRVKELIARIRPHVVYVNTIAPTPVAEAARTVGAPVLWVIRELPQDRLERVEAVSRWATTIVAVSDAVRRRLQLLGVRRPIVKLYNAVPLSDWREQVWDQLRLRQRRAWRLTDDHVAIGFVGKVNEKKGIAHFVRMALRVGRREKKAVFFIFGHIRDRRQPLWRRLRRRIAEARMSRRVVHCGFEENVERVYPGLDIVVVPSLADEPFGRVTAEAMAFRKPVVAYDSGAARELVVHGQTGFIVPKGNVELLSQAVQQLLDPALRHRFGDAGRRRLEALFAMGPHARQLFKLARHCAHRAAGTWRPRPTLRPATATISPLDQKPPKRLQPFVGRVADPPPLPWGTFKARRATVQRLAELQARFLFRTQAGRRGAVSAPIPHFLDAVRAARRRGTLQRQLKQYRRWLPGEHDARLVEQALRRLPRLMAKAKKCPAALAHGDVRWRNLRLDDDGAVRFVRWSKSIIAPVPYDLACWVEETLAFYPEYRKRQKELRDWAIDTYRRHFAKVRRPLPRQRFVHYYQICCLLQILYFSLWEHLRRAASGCPASRQAVSYYMSRLRKWGKEHGIVD
ncbi:MAG: glycosyltransferase [Limnochordales bacterium]